MAVVETEQVGALVEAATTEHRGLWRDAWRRLRQNKAALAGAAYVLLMLVITDALDPRMSR
jgi:N-terminal TM domain of oligopeptide transport permease C